MMGMASPTGYLDLVQPAVSERHRGGYGDGRRGGGHAVPVDDRPRLAGHGARHELRGAERDQRSDSGAHFTGLSDDPRPRLH